jgi:hypothetical protein
VPITKSFDIKRLKPFHRERDRVPNPTPEIEERVAQLDPELKPDEHAYVNHYLHYADMLLHQQPSESITTTPEFPDDISDNDNNPDNVVEMPRRQSGDARDFSRRLEEKHKAA